MAERTQVELELITLFNKARQDVSKFTSDTQKQLSGISFASTVSAINAGFELVEKTAGRAFEAVKDVLSEAVTEAANAEKANIKLAQSMKVVGDFSNRALEDFRKQADAIAGLTTVTDDQVLAGAALAKSFGLTNRETQKVIDAAVELSAVTGEDLNTSINTLAKSYNGFVDKSLAKMIPGLKGLNDKQLEAGKLVEIVEAKFRGTAETLTNTFSGATTQAKNEFGEVLEALGNAIVQNPLVIQTLKDLAQTFRDLKGSIEGNKTELTNFVTDTVVFLIRSIPVAVQALSSMDSAFSTLTATLKDIAIYVTKGPTALLQSLTGTDDALNDLKDSLANVQDTVKAQGRQDKLYDPLIKKANEYADAITKLGEKYKAAGNTGTAAVKQLSNAQEDAVETEIKRQRELEKEREKILQKFTELKPQIKDFGLTELEKVQKDFRDKKVILDKAAEFGLFKDRLEMEQTFSKFAIEEARKVQEAKLKLSTQAGQNPGGEAVKFLTNDPTSAIKNGGDPAALAAGAVGQVLQGAQGAQKLVTSSLAQLGQFFLGIPAEISGPILDALSQGPEKVREMVQSFVQALPDVIVNIAKSIPVLIIELQKAVPKIIKGLIDGIPEIIQAFIDAIPELAANFALQAPTIAIAVAEGLVKNIPKIVEGFAKEFLKIPEQFVKELLKAIPGGSALAGGDGGGGGLGGLLGKIPVVGGVVGGIVGGIGDLFGFAEGGTTRRVASLENDGGIAKIGANETVVDSELTDWLRQLKASGEGFGGPREIVLQIGHQQFARAMFDTRKAGFQI